MRDADDRLGCQKLREDLDEITSVSWNPAGTQILFSTREGLLSIFAVEDVPQPLIEMTNNDLVEACAWSPDGSRVLIGDWSGNLKILSAADMKLVMCMAAHHPTQHGCFWAEEPSKITQWPKDHPEFVADPYVGTTARLAADGWTLQTMPEQQSAIISADRKHILHATPEAWRWLGWEERDAKGRFIRRLPAEAFGPIPGMECPPGMRWSEGQRPSVT
jgi:hypothetical protein